MKNSTGTTYRYYVPAGNNFIVYNRWTNGTNAIDYATRDHLASTAVITDVNGTLVVAEKYAALGWGAGDATIASITRHEFTGHEGLDNYGLWLVDMDGRIYNSSGAIFSSPDPYIQDPSNTQNYDRYSYVYNNPLTHVDPSGFAVGDVEGACSGGYFGDDFGGYSIDLGNNTTLCVGGGLYAGLWDSRNGASSSGNGGGGAGGNSSGKPNLPQQTYDQCIAAATGVQPSSDTTAQQVASYADMGLTVLGSTTDDILNSGATNVGKAFAGASPFGVLNPPTNAGYSALGSQIQGTLEPVGKLLTVGGFVLGGASVAVDAFYGYKNGGVAGASTDAAFGLVDFGVEYGLSSTGPVGAGLAIGYNLAGGSNTLMRGLNTETQIIGCNAEFLGSMTAAGFTADRQRR